MKLALEAYEEGFEHLSDAIKSKVLLLTQSLWIRIWKVSNDILIGGSARDQEWCVWSFKLGDLFYNFVKQTLEPNENTGSALVSSGNVIEHLFKELKGKHEKNHTFKK